MSLHLFTRLLNKCGQEIDVLLRSLDESDFESSQPVETFTSIDTPLAIVKTIGTMTAGDKLFASISVANGATHVFCVLHTATLADVEHANYFIDLNGERYRILAVTNIDERSQVLAIQCVKRGDNTLEAAQA